jgi:hypothetical protein
VVPCITGGLLITERGNLAAGLTETSNDASKLCFISGLLLGRSLFGPGGLTRENELDVGESCGTRFTSSAVVKLLMSSRSSAATPPDLEPEL